MNGEWEREDQFFVRQALHAAELGFSKSTCLSRRLREDIIKPYLEQISPFSHGLQPEDCRDRKSKSKRGRTKPTRFIPRSQRDFFEV